MEKQTFIIPNISCEHCIKAIKNELNELDGIISIEGKVEDKSIAVHWKTPATIDMIKALLTEINYPAL